MVEAREVLAATIRRLLGSSEMAIERNESESARPDDRDEAERALGELRWGAEKEVAPTIRDAVERLTESNADLIELRWEVEKEVAPAIRGAVERLTEVEKEVAPAIRDAVERLTESNADLTELRWKVEKEVAPVIQDAVERLTESNADLISSVDDLVVTNDVLSESMERSSRVTAWMTAVLLILTFAVVGLGIVALIVR